MSNKKVIPAKFKIGDKVKIIKEISFSSKNKVGYIGIITKVNKQPWNTEIESIKCVDHWYMLDKKIDVWENSLRLVEVKKIKITTKKDLLKSAEINTIQKILCLIGENPDREGLKDTPKRVVKMWKEIYRGYDKEQRPKLAIFPNNEDGINYDQMIVDTGYFYSQCEHHMVPFFGEYYFAYIPGDKILGLSKVARVVDYFSAKLQIQERLVKEIVDYLEEELQPKGIALVMKGRHLCKEMRGVKKINGTMTTSDLRGVFKSEGDARAEFMSLIK